MASNTAGKLLIADGTDFEPTAVGDLSEISSIANDDVLLAVDTSGGGLKKVARSTLVSGLATSSALSNIVEDTTPQLGGDLDAQGKDITDVGILSADASAGIYGATGRKRRLPNVKSDNQGIQSHEVRSGLNFLVQSVASDINLLGAVDMNEYIKSNNMKSKIFALYHSCIQEIDRLQQADKAKIAELENKVVTKESELATIKQHLGI